MILRVTLWDGLTVDTYPDQTEPHDKTNEALFTTSWVLLS